MYISEGFDNNLQHYFGCSRHLVDAHIPGVGGSALTSAIMYLFHLCNQTCNGMDLRAHREREHDDCILLWKFQTTYLYFQNMMPPDQH